MVTHDILFIEDNEDFCFFIDKALQTLDTDLKFEMIKEGRVGLETILDFQNTGQKPRLVYLDLNMPDVDGFEILKSIKSINGLRSVPVVVLSSSERSSDISRPMDLGANAYVIKPQGFSHLKAFLLDSINFWLNYNVTSLKTA